MISPLNIRWRDGLSPEAANACCHSWKEIGFFWAAGVIPPVEL
jgi:hypothetical protein